jgi:predicted DsbA family dithiol-disulfide isomerase
VCGTARWPGHAAARAAAAPIEAYFKTKLLSRFSHRRYAIRMLALPPAGGRAGMQQDAMVEAFFKAYFLEGKDLTEASVLMDIAESAGMDRAVAEAHLQNSELHSQTIDSDKAAREMGITGVPFFIFNRQVGLSGAHEAETLLQGMEEAMNAAADD